MKITITIEHHPYDTPDNPYWAFYKVNGETILKVGKTAQEAKEALILALKTIVNKEKTITEEVEI